MPEEICLPSLEDLSLIDNWFLVLQADWFSERSFPVLNALNVQSNTRLKSIRKHAFRNPTIEILWMAYIRLELALEPVMDPDSFAGCHNLRHLELNYNRWGGMTDDRFYRLFGNLTRLRWIELENTGVDQITANTFSCLTALEELNLQYNKLNVLPDGAFDKLIHLTSLYVNSNRIAVVGPASFGEATRSRLRDLDISNNPFSCSCDVLWFRQWLMDSPALFHYSWGDYTCANLPDTPIQDFHMAEQACLLSQASSIFIIIIVVLLVSVMTLASSLYRYRWHLRLVLYEAFRGRGERLRHLQEDHFQYDVFVSFDRDDLDWVLQRLMPELEGRWGLKLCIHERDFIPGQNIVDNIVDSVQASKKVLMLFSASFAASPWCQFELNLCLRHVMDYDDVLLVVLLHEIPARDLTPAMMAVMNITTYIEWDYTPDAFTSFWTKMKVALHEIMPRQ